MPPPLPGYRVEYVRLLRQPLNRSGIGSRFPSGRRITYESLLELLQVNRVQGGLGIELDGLNDTCDTSSMALSPAPLDPHFLDRAHRFLRLWIATGYKMWELDLLLNAPRVGGGVLGQNTLIALQDFWQLQKQPA